MAGEVEDPSLIRDCHRHQKAVRMEVKYELAADVVPYFHCPVCGHEEPLVTTAEPD